MIVALILYGLVPGFIEIAQYFELFFVNTVGLSYNMGVVIYAVLFVAVMILCIKALYEQKSALKIKLLFLVSIVMSDSGYYYPCACSVSVRFQEVAGALSYGDSLERACDLYRLFKLCAAADTLACQSSDEPELSRQCVRPQLIPEPRTIR